MSKDQDLAEITASLQALDITQQDELDTLLAKHRRQKSTLLNKLQRHPSTRSAKHPILPPPILSSSKLPLHRGDKVSLRTKASIGRKGDIATVTKVAPGRVDIFVHRLNDKTWRLPGNLAHCP